MEALTAEIRQRIEKIQARIARAAHSAGRDERQVRLVVVTKAQPVDVILAAVHAGACILGENYPEESLAKIEAVGPGSGISWHMIGHLQSRKAGLAAEHFDMLQSLDSTRLAEKLERRLAELNRVLPVLIEMNVGGEESKFGFQAVDESRWGALEDAIERLLILPHLQVRGLMTMPPLADDVEESRPYFIRLRRLAERLAKRFGEAYFSELSMGTSSDFEIAVQEGATFVRVGTAIVGPRPPRA